MHLRAQRVAVLVDVQNMFYSALHQHNAKLDYKKLLEYIVGERQLVRAISYIVQSPDIDQTGFMAMLDGIGFENKVKNLRQRSDGSAKGDWDMGLAIDAIALQSKIDVLALVSGDGDFCAMITMLQSNGVRVEAYSFPGSTNEDLMTTASQYFPLDVSLTLRHKN